MALANSVRRWLHGRDLAVWHDPAYRLPLPESASGIEPRRADYAAWFLRDVHAVTARNLRKPRRAEYAELSRVHTPELLDALGRPETLARIFAVDASDVRVDELMNTVRLVCGATLEAAHEVLRPSPRKLGRCGLNLLGGFHHAGKNRAGGFCPVNDVAVAVASLRHHGFAGRIAVLDFDAHPPDGTADCLREDREVWIGSLSGSDFGPLPQSVDETVLPEGCGDADYLAALDALLSRMPPSELCFVLAGGDVLAGDLLGKLALTLAGTRARDLRVADALLHVPSVWLPAGGYSKEAWRVLAGTGLALAVRSSEPIPPGYDPLGSRFSWIARSLQGTSLGGSRETSADEIAIDLGLRPRSPLLLGFYSEEGIEHALDHYGVLNQLRRLGFGPFRVAIANDEALGEKLQVFGDDERGASQLLFETLLEKKLVAGAEVLYVHWLTLRNPGAHFSHARPPLPGQEVPGLGLAREASELLSRMAVRLGLAGVAYRPANYHTAYQGRFALRFVDPLRQGRFEALVRDLSAVPLLAATTAVASGKVRLNGLPYLWEPDEMVLWLEKHDEDAQVIAAEREATYFTVG